MRVLFPFVGDTVGGSHRSAALLIAALPKYGVEPICLVHQPGPLLEFLNGRGIPVQVTSDLPLWTGGTTLCSAVRLVIGMPRLWRELRRLKPDAVHVNDAKMTITWAFAARLCSIPLLVHQRTRMARSRITYLAMAQAATIVSISNYVFDTLAQGLRDRATVVTNPFIALPDVDRPAERAALTRELSLRPDVPIIACIGTLQSQKRQSVAVAALAALSTFGLTVNLLLVGRASAAERAELDAAVSSAGLQDTVRILGYREDAEHILHACDVLLAPAVDEGHGRALVEAMLADVPVVAADSGGHREIISHERTGILVPPDQPEAFAAALADLLQNPQKIARIIKCARCEAEGAFSAERHAERLAALYLTIARQ